MWKYSPECTSEANFRFAKYFTVLEPTTFNVCEYWFNKDQNRIRDLRIDTLGQMLNLANIRQGGRYIAVDDASGLLVSAILERMGGSNSNRKSEFILTPSNQVMGA